MLYEQISPYIRVAFDHEIKPPFTLNERVIFDYELLYIKAGEILVTIEDQQYQGLAGDIFLFKPKQTHAFRTVGNQVLRQPHIHFDLFHYPDRDEVKVCFKRMEEIDSDERKWFRPDVTERLPNYIRLQNPLIFEKMLYDVIREMEVKLPFYEINVKGLFTQLWVYLLREIHWQYNPQVLSNLEELIKVQEYLNLNTEREVSLNELAGFSNRSKYYLIRLFKQAFRLSPIQYHQLARIQKAKQMIQFSREPLSEISERFGYQSIHSFSRAFRNVEGVSPSFYRDKYHMRKR